MQKSSNKELIKLIIQRNSNAEDAAELIVDMLSGDLEKVETTKKVTVPSSKNLMVKAHIWAQATPGRNADSFKEGFKYAQHLISSQVPIEVEKH